MGPQYQATVGSFAASPQAQEPQQAMQSPGNQTLGKAMEQSPVHDGFGTRSSMYDNGMDVSAQPAPVATPPQPQNQPATAGVNPSWAQQARKRGGRAKRADGGPLAAFKGGVSPLMMTGDTIAAIGQQPQASGAAPMAQPYQQPMAQRPAFDPTYMDAFPPVDYSSPAAPAPNVYNQKLSNEDFLNAVYQQDLGRAAEQGGRDYWLGRLGSGLSQEDAEKMILGAPEAGNRAFVNQAYQSAFGRAPDQAGADFWVNQLMQGKYTRPDVEKLFMSSPEAMANLAQGIAPDRYGQVDPFVAGYNARMANAQQLYGGIAQANAVQNTADRGEYEAQLAKVQEANNARLAEAQQARAARQYREAEAARQQALAVALMFAMKH